MLAYSVYLGENNTSDFNVRANCHYRLNITLLNDNTAEGIVFEDVDVTNGDRVAAVIVAGRVYANRLPAQPSADDSSKTGAKSTLEKSGVVFVNAPETTRA